ncbi:MAG: efflux RND transporter periplasmic adaptor subunit [Planctomycetota bacterium]|jgi:multidrug efflux pump subunit AcrA (membrane-fusion protein)
MTNKTLLMLLLALAVGTALGAALELRYGLLGSQQSVQLPPDVQDDHEHPEQASQITVWTDRFEIFLEHPPILVGTPAQFVTHVSDLKTALPRTTGPVTFVFSQGKAAPIKHIDPTPARPGIYIPEITFPKAGQWNFSLLIPHNGKEHTVELTPVRVYASHDEIHNAPPTPQIEGISFLKEQQWKLKTNIETPRTSRTAAGQTVEIPLSAVLKHGDENVAFVQLAGETFAERTLTLGPEADGFVQVLSGIEHTDRLVTTDIEALEEAAYAPADAHAHAHGDDPHAHGDDAHALEMSAEDIKRYGIEVQTARPGQIGVHITVPGQIAINTDRMAHIVPNAAGVVRQVISNVGDKVKAGDVMAWLESPELGKAKVDYLTKWAELGCCAMDLTRTRQIHQSTMNLLKTLEEEPPLDKLSQIAGAALDTNHTTLVSAYAELRLAKAAYLREKPLFEKKISSEQDFLAAENAFKKAEAKYAAARDSITFQIQKTLIDAERDQQVREIGVKGAERTLYVLGLTAEDINDVRLLSQGETPTIDHSKICTNPNCTECKKKFSPRGDKEKLAWYPLRAPFDATVIEKHITRGEKLTDESNAYTIADISSVWIDLNVHQKDISFIAQAQPVAVEIAPGMPKIQNRISYVSPIVGQTSRTTLARVVLDNSSGNLRPGTFVTADVVVNQTPAKVAVPRNIIQDVDDKKTVFVRTDCGFEPRTVTLGKANTNLVEITAGIEPGEKIVTKNSFRLKAELEKGAADPHAGHSH